MEKLLDHSQHHHYFSVPATQHHEQKSGPRYQSQNELGSGYGKTGLSDTVNTAKQGSPLEEKSLAYSSTREVHDESEAVQTVINCINRLNTNKKHRYLSGELK